MACREPARRAARFARWVAAPHHGLGAVSNLYGHNSPAAPLDHCRRAPMEPHPLKPRRSFFSLTDLDSMRERVFSSTKTVHHPPDKLFQVVADVAKYSEFVPFCAASRVLKKHGPKKFEAELEIGFKVFSERYVSEVTLEEDLDTKKKTVTATAVPPKYDDGLFTRLVSTWRFEPGPDENTTKVQFEIDFKVNSVVHSQVVSLVFEEVSRLQIGAFETRCDKLFGRGRGGEKSVSKTATDTSDSRASEAMTSTQKQIFAAFEHSAARPTPRRGEDDDLNNDAPGLGLRDFSNACRSLEGIAPFGSNVANRPFLCGALHAALDLESVGKASKEVAAAVVALVEEFGVAGEGLRSTGEQGTSASNTSLDNSKGVSKDTVRSLFLEQLSQIKKRMPNVIRLASSQQQRILDGEDLSGEDEGKDFDILLETAMADVVVEHHVNDVERLVNAFIKNLEWDETRKSFSVTNAATFLSSARLEGILNIGVLHRLKGKR